MLLEHPEDGIHRAPLRKLIDLLQGYSDRSQLIVASHSAAVFNTVTPDVIRLVTIEQGTTKVRALTQREAHAAARFLDEEGSLADFIETVAED
jgi:predicted ATPase